MRIQTTAVGALITVLGAMALGAQPAPPRCVTLRDGALRTPAPLQCVELVPVPSLQGVAGILTAEPAPSPFGVSVDGAGHQRLMLATTIAGLAARTGTRDSVYVAWIASVTMDSVVKLGIVRNGHTELGVTTRDQFRVIISAERDANVRVRAGPIVMRAVSPSARLMAHRDARALPLAPDAPGPPGMRAAWPMPWMPPSMPMMPAVRGLVPDVEPFEPGAGIAPGSLPAAALAQEVTLSNGDTLRLTASIVRRVLDGHFYVGYGYNEQVPGPLIRVRQGSEVRIILRNQTDLPTSIHWHGVRVANGADGAVGTTQAAVAPGGTFTYVVRFPDAGTFWYHGHVREDIQLSSGLAGNIIVEPAPDQRGAGAATPDIGEVMMLSDLLEGSTGPLPFGAAAPTHALSGRAGNRLLVNGGPRFSRTYDGGSVVRIHLTNAASASLFNVSWPGARIRLVAADLSPFEREEWVPSVAIAPGERYVVDVWFPPRGTVAMVNHVRAIEHMLGTISDRVDTLGVYTLSLGAGARRTETSLRANPSLTAEIARLARDVGERVLPDKVLEIAVHPNDRLPPAVAVMLMGPALSAEWNDGMPMENWLTTARDVTWSLRDPVDGTENDAVHWRVRVGDRKLLRIVNDADVPHAMAHPIHLHGQRFVVLRRNGRGVANRAWKDTAIIGAGETVDLLVDFSNPGEWMLHCHIAEHLGAGMMVRVTVDPAPVGGGH